MEEKDYCEDYGWDDLDDEL